jgi:hypothetical protein
MRRAFAEEKPFHLLSYEFLSLLAGGGQTILIDEHSQVIHPLTPGLLRDMVVYPLPQFAAPWGLLEAGKFFAQHHAFHHSL